MLPNNWPSKASDFCASNIHRFGGLRWFPGSTDSGLKGIKAEYLKQLVSQYWHLNSTQCSQGGGHVFNKNLERVSTCASSIQLPHQRKLICLHVCGVQIDPVCGIKVLSKYRGGLNRDHGRNQSSLSSHLFPQVKCAAAAGLSSNITITASELWEIRQ